jgi:hypothetical protein
MPEAAWQAQHRHRHRHWHMRTGGRPCHSPCVSKRYGLLLLWSVIFESKTPTACSPPNIRPWTRRASASSPARCGLLLCHAWATQRSLARTLPSCPPSCPPAQRSTPRIVPSFRVPCVRSSVPLYDAASPKEQSSSSASRSTTHEDPTSGSVAARQCARECNRPAVS